MDIKLITSEAEHNEALAEIERLWDAEADTRDEAKLELLAMLVHNYERSMEQQGLTRRDLLPVFGTTASRST